MNEAVHADSVDPSRRWRLVLYGSLLIVLGFAVAAQVSPPDVYSQVIGTVVVLAVTLPLSYWLAYAR
jgi:Sec-independent protein secretion pathway component TatC